MAVATGHHRFTFQGLLKRMPMRNTTKSRSALAVNLPGNTLAIRHLQPPYCHDYDCCDDEGASGRMPLPDANQARALPVRHQVPACFSLTTREEHMSIKLGDTA